MKINSIFRSINGEVNLFHQGSVCTFIRLAGCNCRCKYCDTVYAQKKTSGIEMSIEQIIEKVRELHCHNITITGGEPLVQQKELKLLVDQLSKEANISIETNGSIEIPYLWSAKVDSWVIDYKCSSSGMKHLMKDSNFARARIDSIRARTRDFIKFVIANRQDFRDAVLLIKRMKKVRDVYTLVWAFSPMFVGNEMACQSLLDWIATEKELEGLNIVVNVQIHKLINVP